MTHQCMSFHDTIVQQTQTAPTLQPSTSTDPIVRAWCRYTRGRFQRAHGGRFERTHGERVGVWEEEGGGGRGCKRDTPTPTPTTHTHTQRTTQNTQGGIVSSAYQNLDTRRRAGIYTRRFSHTTHTPHTHRTLRENGPRRVIT